MVLRLWIQPVLDPALVTGDFKCGMNNLWWLYQEADVVDPNPGVALVDAASPGRLVHLLHCSNGDVWHSGVGQSEGDTDPL